MTENKQVFTYNEEIADKLKSKEGIFEDERPVYNGDIATGFKLNNINTLNNVVISIKDMANNYKILNNEACKYYNKIDEDESKSEDENNLIIVEKCLNAAYEIINIDDIKEEDYPILYNIAYFCIKNPEKDFLGENRDNFIKKTKEILEKNEKYTLSATISFYEREKLIEEICKENGIEQKDISLEELKNKIDNNRNKTNLNKLNELDQNIFNNYNVYYKGESDNIPNNVIYNMAYCYEFGIGYKKNTNMVFDMYLTKERSYINNSEVENKIGTLYYKEKKDINTAIGYFKKAAAQGNKNAIENLRLIGVKEEVLNHSGLFEEPEQIEQNKDKSVGDVQEEQKPKVSTLQFKRRASSGRRKPTVVTDESSGQGQILKNMILVFDFPIKDKVKDEKKYDNIIYDNLEISTEDIGEDINKIIELKNEINGNKEIQKIEKLSDIIERKDLFDKLFNDINLNNENFAFAKRLKDNFVKLQDYTGKLKNNENNVDLLNDFKDLNYFNINHKEKNNKEINNFYRDYEEIIKFLKKQLEEKEEEKINKELEDEENEKINYFLEEEEENVFRKFEAEEKNKEEDEKSIDPFGFLDSEEFNDMEFENPLYKGNNANDPFDEYDRNDQEFKEIKERILSRLNYVVKFINKNPTEKIKNFDNLDNPREIERAIELFNNGLFSNVKEVDKLKSHLKNLEYGDYYYDPDSSPDSDIIREYIPKFEESFVNRDKYGWNKFENDFKSFMTEIQTLEKKLNNQIEDNKIGDDKNNYFENNEEDSFDEITNSSENYEFDPTNFGIDEDYNQEKLKEIKKSVSKKLEQFFEDNGISIPKNKKFDNLDTEEEINNAIGLFDGQIFKNTKSANELKQHLENLKCGNINNSNFIESFIFKTEGIISFDLSLEFLNIELRKIELKKQLVVFKNSDDKESETITNIAITIKPNDIFDNIKDISPESNEINNLYDFLMDETCFNNFLKNMNDSEEKERIKYHIGELKKYLSFLDKAISSNVTKNDMYHIMAKFDELDYFKDKGEFFEDINFVKNREELQKQLSIFKNENNDTKEITIDNITINPNEIFKEINKHLIDNKKQNYDDSEEEEEEDEKNNNKTNQDKSINSLYDFIKNGEAVVIFLNNIDSNNEETVKENLTKLKNYINKLDEVIGSDNQIDEDIKKSLDEQSKELEYFSKQFFNDLLLKNKDIKNNEIEFNSQNTIERNVKDEENGDNSQNHDFKDLDSSPKEDNSEELIIDSTDNNSTENNDQNIEQSTKDAKENNNDSQDQDPETLLNNSSKKWQPVIMGTSKKLSTNNNENNPELQSKDSQKSTSTDRNLSNLGVQQNTEENIKHSKQEMVNHLSNLYYLIGTSNEYNNDKTKVGVAVAHMLNARGSRNGGADGVVATLKNLVNDVIDNDIGNETNVVAQNITGEIFNSLNEPEDSYTEYCNKLTLSIDKYVKNRGSKNEKYFRQQLENDIYGVVDKVFIDKAKKVYNKKNSKNDDDLTFLNNFYNNFDDGRKYIQQTTTKAKEYVIELKDFYDDENSLFTENDDKSINVNNDKLKEAHETLNTMYNCLSEDGNKTVKVDSTIKKENINFTKEQIEETQEAMDHTERVKNQFEPEDDDEKKIKGFKKDNNIEVLNTEATRGVRYPDDYSEEYMDLVDKTDNFINVEFHQDENPIRLGDLKDDKKDKIKEAYGISDENETIERILINGIEFLIPTKYCDWIEINKGIGRERGVLPGMLEYMKKIAVINGGNVDKIKDLISLEIGEEKMTITEAIEKGKGSKVAEKLLGKLSAVASDATTSLNVFLGNDKDLLSEVLGEKIVNELKFTGQVRRQSNPESNESELNILKEANKDLNKTERQGKGVNPNKTVFVC